MAEQPGRRRSVREYTDAPLVDDEVHSLLLMPATERPVYLLPVGRPR